MIWLRINNGNESDKQLIELLFNYGALIWRCDNGHSREIYYVIMPNAYLVYLYKNIIITCRELKEDIKIIKN